MKEMPEDFRTQDEREHQAIDGAPEVGGVADVIGVAPGHVPAVEQIQGCKNVSGHRDGDQVDVDTHPWLEKDAGEKDGRYGPGGTDGVVIPVIPVLDQISDSGHGEGRHIEDDVENPSCRLTPHGGKVLLHHPAKKEQREHVEKQMPPPRMDQTIREHLPPFLPVPDIERIELQDTEIQPPIKAQETHGNRDENDDDCDHVHKDTQNLSNVRAEQAIQDRKPPDGNYPDRG